MTEEEMRACAFVCPYHGRIPNEHVTTMKTCGECMEKFGVDAGNATLLIRAPYEGHAPRWDYDCVRCRYAWTCGPVSGCFLRMKTKTPLERMAEVNRAVELREVS